MSIHLSMKTILLSTAVLSLGACAVGPDYEEPWIEKPASFVGSEATLAESSEASLQNWWTSFGDATLTTLIEKACESNLDAKIAAERIVEARARARQAGSDLYPSVDANLDYTRTDRLNGDKAIQPGVVSPGSFYSAGIDAIWEIDLVGQIRRGQSAAGADAEAIRESYRDVLVTLQAEVALAYAEFRTLEERLRIAHSNSRLQQATVDLVTARQESGLISTLDVSQAKANLQSTRALVPSLQARLNSVRNRLGILIGGYPQAAEPFLGGNKVIPMASGDIAIGAPAELLRRRPDIRQQEREMAAQSERIGIAVAEWYPKLSLFGSLRIAATDVGDLTSDRSGIFQFGPSLSWNIFAGGAITEEIKIQESRFRQATLQYEAALKLAIEEVENAAVNIAREAERRQELSLGLAAAQDSVEVANAQYAEGLVGFQTVVDTQRSLQVVEDQLATSRGELAMQMIALYKALGGGWQGVARNEADASTDQAKSNGEGS